MFFPDCFIHQHKHCSKHRARMPRSPLGKQDCSSEGGAIGGVNKCCSGVQDGNCGGESDCQCSVSHSPQSQTWSLAWCHWGPVCSWWSWWSRKTHRVTNIHDIFGQVLDGFCQFSAKLVENSWQGVYSMEERWGHKHSEAKSCSYSCLISWIFSWQSSSSGWSWARCLASCSLAVCWDGRFEEIYANCSSLENGEDTKDELWDNGSCKTLLAKGGGVKKESLTRCKHAAYHLWTPNVSVHILPLLKPQSETAPVHCLL